MVDTIKTPLFMINSKYDHWQIQNIFQTQWTPDLDEEESRGVLQYGMDFMKALQPLVARWDRQPRTGNQVARMHNAQKQKPQRHCVTIVSIVFQIVYCAINDFENPVLQGHTYELLQLERQQAISKTPVAGEIFPLVYLAKASSVRA